MSAENCALSFFTVGLMDASFRDWAGLPMHIVDLFVIKLDKFFDFVRFCGVCPQWRNAAHEANVVHKASLDVLKASRKKLPMLVFKTDGNNNEKRSVYDFTNKTTFDIKLPFSYKYRFVGSSCGWLICTEKPMAVTLVNPINNNTISLPMLKDPCGSWHKDFDYYITRGILLSDPDSSPNSFVLVVIYGGLNKVAFLNSKEQSWNFINSEGFFSSDIIHYKGKLYGVDNFGKLFEIDIPSKTIRSIVPGAENNVDATYLVESQDSDLLMVKRAWFDEITDDDDDDDDDDEDNHVEARAAEHSGNEDNDDNYIYRHSESETSDREGESNPRFNLLSVDSFPRSFEFKVYKMSHPIEEGSATWVKIKNIGPQALFVGDNQSLSVSTTNFQGCLPNSIYYITDHHNFISPYVYRGLNEDSGVFDLENGTSDLFHVLDSSQKYVHPPIWFVPNPREINLG